MFEYASPERPLFVLGPGQGLSAQKAELRRLKE